MHLLLNQWQYKLLQSLDHWLLKQQADYRSPYGGPFPVPALLPSPKLAIQGERRFREKKASELLVQELENYELGV